jgi:hypothetical protein
VVVVVRRCGRSFSSFSVVVVVVVGRSRSRHCHASCYRS